MTQKRTIFVAVLVVAVSVVCSLAVVAGMTHKGVGLYPPSDETIL